MESAKENADAGIAAKAAGKNTGDVSGKSEDRKPKETDKDGPLYKYFTDLLKDMYYAENHILPALQKMQKAATTEELREAFEDHHLQTQKHVSRLERVFKNLDESPEEKKCDAIDGIIKEGEKTIEDTTEGSMTRDAALIIAAQKVEHYEIASYGGLCALAETLGFFKASDLLHKTLEEECRTDGDLSHIAESYINFYASEDDEAEDDDNDKYSNNSSRRRDDGNSYENYSYR